MDYRLYYEWIVGEWIDEFILGWWIMDGLSMVGFYSVNCIRFGAYDKNSLS